MAVASGEPAHAAATAFANTGPTGTADDITLAIGSVVSGSFELQPNGQLGAHFAETFAPVLSESAAFLNPTKAGLV